MTTIAKKEELIKWISSIKSKEVIDQLFAYKKEKSKNFDDAIKDAISTKQLKEDTTAYITSLDWNK